MSGSLDRFNGLPAADAERELLACCAARTWARTVAGGRPYPDGAALAAAGDAALAELTWPDIAEALAGHPRIGQRAAGSGRDAAWSRREQAGVDGAGAAVRDALAEANREYEQRFGHVFLIFASGRTPAELLAAARERLGHDGPTERRVVRDELAKITRLRLERLVG
ncbi:MAG: OHCU decarboxylase [Actinobacteria bacterium 13_2_20CM_2_72_6]|nr:MAG: OHCU decarboxylase [Actinobacteria bacterium 13_2_20CM_2_72_6]